MARTSLYPADSIIHAYKRVDGLREKQGLAWDELAAKAGIKAKSWMVGLPYTAPTERDLKKIAPVLGVTYKYLRYGE